MNATFKVKGPLAKALQTGILGNLKIGQYVESSHSFTREAVKVYSELCGDNNPIHVDEEYAKARSHGGIVVPGLLAAGLLPMLVGRIMPGTLYTSQSLKFEKSILVGDILTARMDLKKVKLIRGGTQALLVCDTLISKASDGLVFISGEGKLLILSESRVPLT